MKYTAAGLPARINGIRTEFVADAASQKLELSKTIEERRSAAEALEQWHLLEETFTLLYSNRSLADLEKAIHEFHYLRKHKNQKVVTGMDNALAFLSRS